MIEGKSINLTLNTENFMNHSHPRLPASALPRTCSVRKECEDVVSQSKSQA